MNKKETKERLPKPIEAIGFDIGGVIFPDLHVPVVTHIARKIEIPSGVASEIFDEVWARLCLGKTTEDELWQRLSKSDKAKKPIPPEDFKRLFRSHLVPNRRMVSLTGKLAKNYPLFLIPNTAQEWLDYQLDHYNLRRFFSILATSVEARARKPASEFFDYLIAHLPHPPEACLFIDDREKNTRAAAEFGFRTLLFKNVPQFKTDLKEKGCLH